MSKGSSRRPMNIPRKQFDENWDKIFGNNQKTKAKPNTDKSKNKKGS